MSNATARPTFTFRSRYYDIPEATLKFHTYRDGNLVVSLCGPDGRALGQVSANLPQYAVILLPGEFFLRDYWEWEGALEALETAGVIEKEEGDIPTVPSGFANFPVVKLAGPWLAQYFAERTPAGPIPHLTTGASPMSVDVSSPSLSDVLHAMLHDPRTSVVARPRPRNFRSTPTQAHTPHLGNLPTLLNVYAWLAHEHDVAQGRARHFAKLGPETAAESTRRARHCARAMSVVHDQIQQIIAAGVTGEA